jgi:diguanylate cyclase (GGDEF)-like protein
MEDPRIGTIGEPGVGTRRRLGAAARSKRRRTAWGAGATLLAIVGIAGASLGATALARSDAHRSHEAFVASSAEIASTLKLTILHEEDLVVSAQAFFAEHSDATNTEFVRWASAIRAFDRYPELVGFGFSEIVPASQLDSYAARVTKDPPATLGPGGKFQLWPEGDRPYYCLAPVGRTRRGSVGPAAGFDFCAADPKGSMLAALDAERGVYAPVKFGHSTSLSISSAVYRAGAVPSTPAGRRAALLGWVGMAVVPRLVMERALQGHPGMTATMRFRQGPSDVAFSSGTRPNGARTVSRDLHNGWTVLTFRAVEAGGVFRNAGASAVLGAGLAVSVLLAVLLFVLATGRARAWRVVDDKTDELRHQALHDSLTGLPNRALVVDRADQLLARNRRAGCDGAAMFLDLDEFKNVNDNLGHEAGDELLKAVADRLAGCLRESDTVGRIGGDEFVVLVDGGPLNVGAGRVADRLLDVLRQPFDLAGAVMPVTVTASIGIAVGDRSSAGALLRDADVAMYLAKGAGKNRYETFGPQMEIDVRHRYEMEFDLRSALEADQFRLVYQPIYSLDDLSVTGVEALLRWDHPTLGVVSPGEFIPLLEASGHIVEVGRAVLIEACRQMASWHSAGSELGVSVNVSARQLDHDVIVDQVREALALSGLDAAMLTIEVTETALMANADTTAQRLHQLKALGVQLAIDDFGTGYSSLAYLQKFPVDSLKIDRTFTDGISRSPESKALIHTLVQLGRDLGLRTLAEGVETSEQIDHLRGQHVNEAQGFLLARPLDPVTFETTILGYAPQPAGEHAIQASRPLKELSPLL